MLENLEWLSINKLAAETRLIEAWKSIHQDDYCMTELLHLRHKGAYRTRQNHINFLETGVEDIYGSAGFVNTTARLWNKSPDSVKEAKTLSQAKREIRKFVIEEIPV